MTRGNEEHLFIGTTPGLEPALEAEVRALGLGLWRVPGGVEVKGAPGLHQTLNLHLRTASRVLLRAASFPAPDASALERGLERVELSGFWRGDVPLDIEASAAKSRVSNAGHIRDIAARAWKAELPPRGTGPEPEEEGAAHPRVQLRLVQDVCTVSVDTSGELLYRRGYRQEVSRAPLRETLAAGMLILAGYTGDEPLWDPMCGSGTLPVEAALLALRRAPGRDRSFAFQQWPTWDAAAWEQRVADAKAKEREAPPQAIWATDLNAGSLGTARRNARRAGVVQHLTLERLDARAPQKKPPGPAGLLVANPPYGKRVGGDADEVTDSYRALGRLLREELPGWRAAILAPDVRLERALGLEPEDSFEVNNGGIRCQLLIIPPSGRAR